MSNIKNSKKIDQIIAEHKAKKSGLVGVLQDIQSLYSYLPQETLRYVSQEFAVPLSQTYSLATYYRAFSLKPQGKYLVSLCMGTACHVRASERILGEVERSLKIKAGQTTDDQKFTLETVNCLGACALGPLMVINGKYFGSMTVNKIAPILEKYAKSK